MTSTLSRPTDTADTAGSATTPTVTRLGKNIGAVIEGIDLSGDITDDEVEFIRTALATHKAVGFRGQFLDDESQYAFASRIGTPTLAHPTVHSTGLDRLV
ncbi:TauD/TfdA dioxygenase family protein, partial [Corynebacterium variabile]